ncbi:MAG: DUF1810 domain-containing protein [Clostridia bacterium]|nr:DUF1810 domain-containing protein [Clostridia bacterium]
MKYNLQRFIDAQREYYEIAKSELTAGEKQSHYMWFVFPQIKGLGHSTMAKYYAIADIDEARLYMQNSILREHMNELLDILLNLPCDNAHQIFGTPDDIKLKSSMTLFKAANLGNERFDKILQKFFKGEQDEYTIQILKMQNDLENTNNI